VAGKNKAVGMAIKYGPLVYPAVRKYGPQVWEQVRAQREPAERFVQDKVAKGNQRKKALQHAGTVVDGSVLQVFHRNTAHWVVFSGDEPIAVHPPTTAPYEVLLKHADLSTRVRPGEGTRLPRPHRPRPTTGSTSRRKAGRTPASSQVRYHDDETGTADAGTQGRLPPAPGSGGTSEDSGGPQAPEGQRPTA
jgi:hypothetical protein